MQHIPPPSCSNSMLRLVLFKAHDSGKAVKARLTLCINPLDVKQCGFVSKAATGEDFSSKDFFFFFFIFLQSQQNHFAVALLRLHLAAGPCLRGNTALCTGPVSPNSCKGGDAGTVSHPGWEDFGVLLPAQVRPLLWFLNRPLMRGQQSERAENKQQRQKINIRPYRQQRSIYLPGVGAQPCCQSGPARC